MTTEHPPRPAGTGTLEELPSGRVRAKLPGKGRPTLDVLESIP